MALSSESCPNFATKSRTPLARNQTRTVPAAEEAGLFGLMVGVHPICAPHSKFVAPRID
jgi:hypothetical protein